MIFKAENNLSVISFGGNTLKSCPLFNLLSLWGRGLRVSGISRNAQKADREYLV